MKLTRLFFLLLALFSISACEEEKLPDVSNPSENVKASVVGRVYINDQIPAANFQVTLSNGAVTTTDSDGTFSFSNESITAPYSYVKVKESTNFFAGSRTFFVQENSVNYVKIKLLPKELRGTFHSATGGQIDFEGVSVSLPPNAVMYPNGGAYSGYVSLVGKYLSPNDPDLQEIMPGDLLGFDEYNTHNLLKTFGMIAVELLDQTGQSLQVATGKKATISLPQIAGLEHTGKMPLWYFEEKSGYWLKEGFATLQNGKWTGEVSHFSFWNCDVSTITGTIKMKIVTENGVAISNAQVLLSSPDYGTRSAISNSEGIVEGLVPASQTLSMSINVGAACGIWVYPQTIQTHSGLNDLGNIAISTYPNTAHFVGTLKGCNGSTNANHQYYLFIKSGVYLTSYIIQQGNVNIHFPYCGNGNSVQMKVYDYTQGTYSEMITKTLTNGEVNLGEIEVCNGVAGIGEFLQYKIDAVSYFVSGQHISCNSNPNPSGTDISIYMDNSTMHAGLHIHSLLGNDSAYIKSFFFPSTNGSMLINTPVNISHFASFPNEFFDGNFSHTYTDSTGTHNVDCLFHVKRDY
ncbi:MAG: astroprincin family protein [Bacteroidia bacterium]